MKIHYSITSDSVSVELFEGEGYASKTSDNEPTVFALGDCPAELADGAGSKSFAAYGLLKWLQDRTSGVKGSGEKVAAMVEEFESKALQGLWRAERQSAERKASGGRRKVGASLAQAVAELLGVTALEAEASLKAIDKDKFDTIAAREDVKARVAELNASVEAGVDMSGLLG